MAPSTKIPEFRCSLYRIQTPFEPFRTPFEPPWILEKFGYCQNCGNFFFHFFAISIHSTYLLANHVSFLSKNLFKVAEIICWKYAYCSFRFFCLEKLEHFIKCTSQDKNNLVRPFESIFILVFKNINFFECLYYE